MHFGHKDISFLRPNVIAVHAHRVLTADRILKNIQFFLRSLQGIIWKGAILRNEARQCSNSAEAKELSHLFLISCQTRSTGHTTYLFRVQNQNQLELPSISGWGRRAKSRLVGLGLEGGPGRRFTPTRVPSAGIPHSSHRRVSCL